MGIDLIAGGKVKNTNRKGPSSENVYLKLLVKLYRFLARRTDSKFNQVVLKRLYMSKVNRPPMAISRVARYVRGRTEQKGSDKIVVIVGTITDDPRLLEIPKLTICALKFTSTVRARILKAGGECLTFDQLALRAPTGSNTILLRGPKLSRTTCKYWGAAGLPNSSARAYNRSKGRNHEKARGRKGKW